ncbi:hypothetical protein KQ211_000865 [Listeria monocytogenes]|nr:hypothetical protein [Listeria monocytogenes]EIB9699757.1 hypothetical protein [Listeria monocytogenes]
MSTVTDDNIKHLYLLGYQKEFDSGEAKCLVNQQKRTLTIMIFSDPTSDYRCEIDTITTTTKIL